MRHIPATAACALTPLSFEEALRLEQNTPAAYDKDAWLFLPDEYAEYRYILGTLGQKPLICFGVNPSTAAPNALDPTLQSCRRIAQNNGYDAFLMMNLSAQRATLPQDMDREAPLRLHQENLKAFRYLLARFNAPPVWAAWGNMIALRPYLVPFAMDFYRLGQQQHVQWLSAGPPLKSGHPHHPLYLKQTTALIPMDMEEYFTSLGFQGSANMLY